MPPSDDRESLSEAHLGSVLSIMAEAVISVDASQRIVFFNRGAEEIFGYAAHEVLGQPLDVLLPKRFHHAHHAHVETFEHSGVTARQMGEQMEVRALRRSGEEFAARASIVRTEGPRGPILTAVLRDVSEEHRAHEELAKRERQLAEAQAIAHIGSWEWAVETDRVSWSDELYRIFGLEPGTPIDFQAFLERVHPADRERVQEVVRRGMTSDAPFEFHHRIMRADGEERWLHGRGEVVRNEEGRAVRLHGTSQDVTLVREAEEKERRLLAEQAARQAAQEAEKKMAFLARASAELATSLDYESTLATVAELAVPDMADWCAVDLLDDEGRIQRLTVAHEDPDKLTLVRRLQERYPPDPDASYGAPHVIRTGQPEMAREISDEFLREVARDDEHLRILRDLRLDSYVVAPLAVRDRVLGAITVVRAGSGRRYDEEDRVLIEDLARRAALAIENARLVRDLEQAIEAKNDFMATVSHELRTPLNAIIGYAQLLEEGVPEPVHGAARVHAEHITLAARHLLQLIDEILTFSRLQAGREQVEKADVDLGALVDEVRAVVRPLAERKGLAFEARTTEEAAARPISTDPRKLRQILLNLLGNAVKFTEEGRIELVVDGENGALLFTVRDTGRGIPTKEESRIFEPFWQGEETWSGQMGGAGLGLAISRRFAHMLGGEIQVESVPGEGSTFILRLPITD